jgi:hypothetical protein
MNDDKHKREQVQYWIDDIENGVAVFYRNNDTEASVAGGSERVGNKWWAIWEAHRWARENGCGEVNYEPGGPSDA